MFGIRPGVGSAAAESFGLLDHDAAGLVAVLNHYSKCEVADTDDQRGADQVAVDSVSACAAAGFDRQDNSELVVHGIYFVGDPVSLLAAGRASDRW